MNRMTILFLLAATAASAQTTPAKQAGARPAVHSAAGATISAIKLPPGVPPVKGLMHTGFSLRYQEIKIGTGPVAEPNKVYEVAYTGWLAADGKKFDSSFDHPDKKPIQFPQGRGRVIPGWDQGFEGMKIGGKRRLFIPYQLAYGAMGRAPVIPAKANLIFDIELVGVTDMPPPGTPGGPGSMMGRPRPSAPPAPSSAPATPAPGSTAAPQPPQPPASQKPTDPTAPTTAPNSAPPPSSAPSSSTPATPPPAAAPDKPANPAQPNPTK